ncbi:MAG: hypothetical protein O7C59_01505 [Rickettsia endosymbiont of Ixodes persulcatus]|nr:hypothetical protein [Rickettsia endosymbiont of Ixodes persulcatus]
MVTIYELIQGKPMNELLFDLMIINTKPEQTELAVDDIEYNESRYGYQYSESELVGELNY